MYGQTHKELAHHDLIATPFYRNTDRPRIGAPARSGGPGCCDALGMPRGESRDPNGSRVRRMSVGIILKIGSSRSRLLGLLRRSDSSSRRKTPELLPLNAADRATIKTIDEDPR